MENIDSATPAVCHTAPRTGPGGTAIELRRNGFFPILIVILLLISKNLSRARLRLGLRLRACQCGPAAGLNSMAVGSEGHPRWWWYPDGHASLRFRKEDCVIESA